MPPKIEDPFPSNWTQKPHVANNPCFAFLPLTKPKKPKLFSSSSAVLGVVRLRWLGCSGFCDLIYVGFNFVSFDGFRQVLISVAGLIGVAERWVWVDWFGGGVLICRLWEAVMVVLGDYIYFFFGCGELQFVVIVVVGGVTVAECGWGVVVVGKAVLVVARCGFYLFINENWMWVLYIVVKYIILLYFLYYFNVLYDKIEPLILSIL